MSWSEREIAAKLLLGPRLLGRHVADVGDRAGREGDRLELEDAPFRVGDGEFALRPDAEGETERAQCLGRLGAEQRLRRRVDARHGAGLVEDDDAAVNGVEERVDGLELLRHQEVLLAQVSRVQFADMPSHATEEVFHGT